jgi:hypothetical protein
VAVPARSRRLAGVHARPVRLEPEALVDVLLLAHDPGGHDDDDPDDADPHDAHGDR